MHRMNLIMVKNYKKGPGLFVKKISRPREKIPIDNWIVHQFFGFVSSFTTSIVTGGIMHLHVCPSWLSFILDNALRKGFHNPVAICGRYIQPGDTVMDIGCGNGYFTIPMSQMAGEAGTVIAVDLQRPMLDKMLLRARRLGLSGRIRAVQCGPGDIMVRDRVDFILTFWMVHEVGDAESLFRQIAATMKSGSRYLLVEPKLHVTKKKYREIVEKAARAGLRVQDEPVIALSRSILFSR